MSNVFDEWIKLIHGGEFDWHDMKNTQVVKNVGGLIN